MTLTSDPKFKGHPQHVKQDYGALQLSIEYVIIKVSL